MTRNFLATTIAAATLCFASQALAQDKANCLQLRRA